MLSHWSLSCYFRFHVDSTISAIERSLSQQGPPKTVMTQEAAEQIEEKMFQQAVEESLKMVSNCGVYILHSLTA